MICELVTQARVGLDPERGLDHGCWSVLRSMYGGADIPVVQLSLDTSQPASFHYGLAKDLAPLRGQDVLIVGSGNIVHNLALLDFHRPGGFDWADRFNEELKRRILAGEHDELVAYDALGSDARLAMPTPEHYLPLLYVLALQADSDSVSLFNDQTVMGSISMTSVMLGRQ